MILRTRFPSLLRTALAGLALAHAHATVAAGADAPADRFVSGIQPLLEQRCFECHGPERQRSGYRLDRRSTAFKGGDSGMTAIVPGDPERSHLFELVSGKIPESRMPPKGEPLRAEEVELLRKWIADGAEWPESGGEETTEGREWWSLRPLHRPPVPAAQPGLTARTPVDQFIQDRLAREGRTPAPEADRRTLIRRLHLDLLGLPPSPEEVSAFVADPGPDAYERLVDRLLASPHYGERWARHWMDVVHYGDTHGYDKDQPRPQAWPYRDYLIRAFNEDRSYSRMVREQIAGDVLYPGSRDGIEALGFIAAGPWDFIGHIELPETKFDGRQARHLDRDDMVANTMGTFVSLTVHCAQCHDHKFDPIPQQDYYRLQAVFAALDRTERRYHAEPELNLRRTALETRLHEATRREQQLRATVRELGGEPLAEAERTLEAKRKSGDRPEEYGYHSAIEASADTLKWVQLDLGEPVEIDRVVLRPTQDDFNGIGAGFGFPRRYRVEVSDDPTFATGVRSVADRTSADVPGPGVTAQSHPAEGRPKARYVRVTATRLALRQADYIFALAELEVLDAAGVVRSRGAAVTALDSIEAPSRWRKTNLTDGRYPGQPSDPGELERLTAARDALLVERVPAAVRDELEAVGRNISGTRKALEALPAPLVAFVGAVHHGSGNFRGTGPDGGRPRPIQVLSRGDLRKPLREVGPGALECVDVEVSFPDPQEAEGARRAALAEWITAREHPLTWRSIVNRVWQQRFGRGLVETPNDFGRMGAEPTHPELLDWLAVEFRDGGQSFKALDRLLVTSATYRQSSSIAPETTAGPAPDTENRGWSRMNRRRLDAEAVRDSLLAVSGRLDRRMYGPGFQDFVVEKPEHSPHYQYHLHDPEDPRSHRRSVYRFLVRSQQEPFMVALDCADPSMRVDRRNETLTPLQALALLNSRLTVAMARHFAERVEREVGEDSGRRVERAFQVALQRDPEPEEKQALVAYEARHGLAATCRLLLNLNEFVLVD